MSSYVLYKFSVSENKRNIVHVNTVSDAEIGASSMFLDVLGVSLFLGIFRI